MTTLTSWGLAMIIAGPLRENIGRIVTTVRPLGSRTSPATGETHECWKVMAPPGRPLVGYENGQKAPSYHGPFPAAWLMSIEAADGGWIDFGQDEAEGGAS